MPQKVPVTPSPGPGISQGLGYNGAELRHPVQGRPAMDIRTVIRFGFLGLVLGISSCGKNGTDPADPDGDGDGSGVPGVFSASPDDGETQVPVNANIVITFSIPMDRAAAAAA